MFDNPVEQVKSLHRKATTAYEQGDYELGIQFAQQACELGKYAFGENNHHYSQPLVIANPDYDLRWEPPLSDSVKSPKSLKESQSITKEIVLAVPIAFGLMTFFVVLAAFPTIGGLLLLLGIMWLWVAVQKWSYGDRLEKFEQQAQALERQGVLSESELKIDSTPTGGSPQPPLKRGAKSEWVSTMEPPKIPIDFGSLARELGRENGDIFKPLPGTKIEGERIAQLLKVPVYTDTQAVKSLLSDCHSPKIVHLATHGYFLEVAQDIGNSDRSFRFDPDSMRSRFSMANSLNPLTRSGLAFAGANTALRSGKLPVDAEDGLLTSQGTIGLDLTGTKLVILSACNTALGNVKIGEGVIGLRRSFIFAGAETLVMSLWKVADIPTAILMERFYHHVFENKLGRTECLEAAQAYLRYLTVGQMRSPLTQAPKNIYSADSPQIWGVGGARGTGSNWLTEEAIRKVGSASYQSGNLLKQLKDKPDKFRPFKSPYYWAAFVCIGDDRLMNREDSKTGV